MISLSSSSSSFPFFFVTTVVLDLPFDICKNLLEADHGLVLRTPFVSTPSGWGGGNNKDFIGAAADVT